MGKPVQVKNLEEEDREVITVSLSLNFLSLVVKLGSAESKPVAFLSSSVSVRHEQQRVLTMSW